MPKVDDWLHVLALMADSTETERIVIEIVCFEVVRVKDGRMFVIAGLQVPCSIRKTWEKFGYIRRVRRADLTYYEITDSGKKYINERLEK